MDNREPVSVYTAGNAIQAAIVKNFLTSEGITSFIEDENQAMLKGVPAVEVRVFVRAADADRARRLIEEQEPHKRA
jgi:Putative prokaryotic signal transducing protein